MKCVTATLLAISAAVLVVVVGQAAQAHGTGANGGLAGLSHPILGLDHLVLLISTGVAAAMLSPVCLLWAMGGAAAGALLGSLGLNLPHAELLASLGAGGVALLCVTPERGRPFWGTIIAAVMLVHAQLHGLEAPTGTPALWWWGGALTSSLLISLGSWLTVRSWSTQQQRALVIGLVAAASTMALVPAAQLWGSAGI